MAIEQILILDTETTGINPAEGAALLEVALVSLDKRAGAPGWDFGDAQRFMVAYDGVIPPEARAVHHITSEEVSSARHAGPANPESDIFARELLLHSLLGAEEPGQAYAAHNAAFDRAFLPELGTQPGGELPWICTYRCAKHLWQDAPNHKNQTLRYYLGVEPPPKLLQGQAPHRALYDAAVTAAILRRMLEARTAEQLVELTSKPVLQTMVRFGKYRGQPWSAVPKDYLKWMLDKSDLCRGDNDLAYTVKSHLGRVAA